MQIDRVTRADDQTRDRYRQQAGFGADCFSQTEQ